ncbi:hypothetical protein LguiA_013686 [Lonicera macranthoides]
MAGNETVRGPALSRSTGHGLMQNCDLPPPLKIFAGPNKTVFSSMNWEEENKFHLPRYGFENEKLELLKALRLSQTRAREAERKAAVLIKERETISNALLEESTRLFAYRQWVRLLELQVSKLRRQEGEERLVKNEDDNVGAGSSITWIMAIAICLGVAGVGFVFGCRYLF